MDGTLCSSEHLSRRSAAEVFRRLHGLEVEEDEFIPFGGMGEDRFLGGVAEKYGVVGYDPAAAKAAFFDIYINTYAKPESNIAYPGAVALVRACKAAGIKTAVASSAGMVKVKANLVAAGFAPDDFDAVVGADGFERIKPAPDIFLAAAEQLGVPPRACVVVEDAAAGVAAGLAAEMRVVGVATCLAPGELQTLGADLVRPSITELTLEDLRGVAYTGRATPPPPPPSGAGGGGADAAASERALPAAAPSRAGASPVGWLEQEVPLPGGQQTTRRDLLRLLPLAGAAGCLYVTATRSKAFSYTSPQALLQALLPDTRIGPPPPGAPAAASERVAAFKRFISDLEGRGGGQEVPDFASGLDWFNAPPLSLRRQLSGKVVVLDFWTYCCINCMHVLPELAFLERKYAGSPLAVVGVHSAKFDNEKDSGAIREAVLRYGIAHPVVNDANMTLWSQLGVSSWPTLVVVSPRGRVLGRLSGEGHQQDLDDFLAAALEFYGEAGLLNNTPVPQSLERDRGGAQGPVSLRYPGKLALDTAGRRLFISDSNNHRVVAVDLEGRFLFDVGGNGAGLRDGALEAAAFNRPQGLAYSAGEDALYVADTENHALRKVDLANGRVTTLLGNGSRGEDYLGGGRGPSQQLNSPWDVVLDPARARLLIAMAGQHQIWSYDLTSGVALAFSGTGYERNQNGPSGATTAWAQPSGLALSPGGRVAYVADSESSTVRVLDLETGGGQALVGGDPLFSDNLFRFGDADGAGASALLQHPLAVAVLPAAGGPGTASGGAPAGGDRLLVADSYNHRLKVLDVASGSVVSAAGGGRAGLADGAGARALVSEPGGLAAAPDGRVYVADTNNSLVRVFEPPATAGGVGVLRTLQIREVPEPRVSPLADPLLGGGGAGGAGAPLAGLPAGAKLVTGPEVSGRRAAIAVDVKLPRSYHLTRGTPSTWAAQVVGAPGAVVRPAAGQLQEGQSIRVALDRGGGGGPAAELRIAAKVYFCQDGGVCLFEQVVIQLPLASMALDDQQATVQDVALQHTVSVVAPAVLPPVV